MRKEQLRFVDLSEPPVWPDSNGNRGSMRLMKISTRQEPGGRRQVAGGGSAV